MKETKEIILYYSKKHLLDKQDVKAGYITRSSVESGEVVKARVIFEIEREERKVEISEGTLEKIFKDKKDWKTWRKELFGE